MEQGDTFRDFVRQQREGRNTILTAALGVMGAALLAVVGAGLIVWRDQSVQASNYARLEDEVVKLEASVSTLGGLVAELRIAIGVLEARGRAAHPERSYVPAMELDPAESRAVESSSASSRPPG